MASITKRPDGRWRARYRDETGKEHAKHFDRKIDGQRWLDEVTTAVVTGQYVDPRAGRLTLAKYAPGWQASQIGRASTGRLVDNALRVHVLPAMGDRPMAGLRRSDVQGFVRMLSDKLAPGSVRNVYEVLNRVMESAVEDRLLVRSPCTRITLPDLTAGEVVPPSAEAVAAISAAVEPRCRALVVLLAGSGLRIGEALGLAVSDVDFLRRTVRVERQRLQDGSLGPTKTAKSVRTVPLGQVVIDELARHLATYPSDEVLFTTAWGEPLTYRRWKVVWRNALDGTRLNSKEMSQLSGDDLESARRAGRCSPMAFSTHDLRHFTASALISGGASVKQVQAVLGHSSAVITLRVYSHLWPGDDDRTRSVMDAALGPLADSVRTERASQT